MTRTNSGTPTGDTDHGNAARFGTALGIGFRAALATACADALLPLATSSRRLHLVREVGLGTSFAWLATFLVFVLLLVSSRVVVRSKAFGWHHRAVAVSLALAAFVLVLAVDRPMVLHWSLPVLAIALGAGLFVFALALPLAIGLDRFPCICTFLGRAGRFLPLALFVALSGVTLCRTTPWIDTPLGLVAAAVMALLLLFLSWRFATHARASAGNVVALAVVSMGPIAVALLAPRGATLDLPARELAGNPVPRRVLLITVDTLRADAIQALGGPVETRALDGLLADSVVFENAQAPAPWTLPSFVSFLSGTSPWVHGATRFGAPVPPELTNVAEHLRDAGYRTAGIGHNFFLTARATGGFANRGFDHYDVYPKGYHPWSVGLRMLQRTVPALLPQELDTYGLTERALTWLDAHEDEPFFLWVHYLDPHSPYTPPPEVLPRRNAFARFGTSVTQDTLRAVRAGDVLATRERIAWMLDLYLAEVKLVDRQIERILTFLRERDLYDDTLIVFASDHGEEFYEHRSVEHGHSLHREVLHVPFAFKLPKQERGGARIASVVSTESFAPTLLELCGLPCDGTRMTSPSLAASLLGSTSDVPDARAHATGLYSFVEREAIVLDGFKYVRSGEWGDEQFYDLGDDPRELHDLAAQRPDQVVRMREALEAFVGRSRALRVELGIRDRAATSIGEDDRDRLKAIGY